MTKDEFYNLDIDSIVYNTKTNVVLRTTMGYVSDKERLDSDAIYGNRLDSGYSYSIPVSECGDWKLFDNYAPWEVRYVLLEERFFKLEQFVYQRLR